MHRKEYQGAGGPCVRAVQIAEHDLPPMPAKRTDSRPVGFIAAHGEVSAAKLQALGEVVLSGRDHHIATAGPEVERRRRKRIAQTPKPVKGVRAAP